MIYDALHFQTQIIDFAKNPKAIEKGFINGSLLLNRKKSVEDLTPKAFLEKCNQLGIVVIDVRELDETPEFKGENVIRIPLSELEEYSKKLDKNQEIVLFCQTGQRSLAAMNYLQKSGFVGVFHLGRGIESLKNQI